MFDTSFYNQQQGGLRGGYAQGQQAFHGADNDALLKQAIEQIQSGADKMQVIAELDAKNPTIGARLKQLLGMGDGATSSNALSSVASGLTNMFGG